MSLTSCSECHREISTAAEACPHCGNPQRGAVGPKCYACEAKATTRCQCCGGLACAVHLESIFVAHGRGGGHELRCRTCYADAESDRRQQFWFRVLLFIAMIIAFWIVISQPRGTQPVHTQVIYRPATNAPAAPPGSLTPPNPPGGGPIH